jgi:hypothetical protein
MQKYRISGLWLAVSQRVFGLGKCGCPMASKKPPWYKPGRLNNLPYSWLWRLLYADV